MCGPVRVLAGWTGPFPFRLDQFGLFLPTEAESVDAFLAFARSGNGSITFHPLVVSRAVQVHQQSV